MAPPTASRPGRALAVLAALIAVLYGVVVYGAAFGKGSWSPKLGLDLEGGTSVTLIPKVVGSGTITSAQINEAVNIIRARVDAFGVAESEVVAQGSGSQRSIVISIPGSQNQDILNKVQQTAQLMFRPVLQEGAASALPLPTTTPGSSATPGAVATPSPAASLAPGVSSPSPTSSTAGMAVPKGLGAASSPSPSAAAAGTTPAPAGSSPAPAASSPAPVGSSPASTPLAVPPNLLAAYASVDCVDPTKRPGPAPAGSYAVACSQDGTTKYLLGPADIVGTDVSGAQAALETTSTGGTTGNWQVLLNFHGNGSKKFAQTTTALYQKSPPQNQFAIVLDGLVVSAPQVLGPITGGSAQITGNFTQKAATDLANVLRYGALPLSFQPGDVQQISPTLGSSQLRAGLLAGLLGLVLVVLYSLLYYRGLGLVSISSLLASAALTYASVVILGQQIGFRLSLAGVAGLIVAIGITADSFIVYFERLRDEMREGRTLRVAIESGWARARRTILAADFVSFLAAVVLYVVSVGSVRGFAFTLGLTTVIDIVVVFLFTKPMLTVLGRTRFYGGGHPMSGLDPRRIGGRARGSAGPATTIVARRSAAPAGGGATKES